MKQLLLSIIALAFSATIFQAQAAYTWAVYSTPHPSPGAACEEVTPILQAGVNPAQFRIDYKSVTPQAAPSVNSVCKHEKVYIPDGTVTQTYNFIAVRSGTQTCPPANTVKSSGFYNIGTNPDASVPTTACDGGCSTSYTGDGVTKRAMKNGVYNYFFGAGSYSYTGDPCASGSPSPSSGPVPPNDCNAATQSTGQVNGVTVCVPKNDTNNTNTTTPPPTTDPTTGNTTTTSNTTNTNTTNNTSTNTTTTTTTSPDGTVTKSENQTTTKTPPSNFCKANPTDPTCLKNSKFCEENPETLGCATLGTVTDSVVPTVAKPISEIVPKTIGGSGSCPAPVTASFMGRSISFSYDLPCRAASMLRPLILALAWLAAGLIFIGGVKQ